MKSLKLILFGIIVGLAVGMWFGVNIGKGKPFYSNPFDKGQISKSIKEGTGEAVEKAGQKMEKLGTDIKGEPK